MSKKPQGAPAPAVAASPIAGTSNASTPYQFVETAPSGWSSTSQPNTPQYPLGGVAPTGTHDATVAIGTQPSATYFGGPGYPGVPMEITPTPADLWKYVRTYGTPPPCWGVVQKTELDKEGPQYRVIDPNTWFAPATATMVARCDTENDAQMISKLLNEQYWGTQEPAEGKRNPCDCKPSELCDCCASIKQDKQEPLRLTANLAKEYIQNLQGRALTIIDAAIAGEAQNKALKDLFKREFRKSIGNVMFYAYRGMDEGPESDCSDED
jgi:hypothetical protein